MVIASGTRVQHVYVEEVTRGTTPGSPAMKTLRLTTPRRIFPAQNTLETAEVRTDRQIKDIRHGFKRVEGSFGYELSLQSYDDFIQYLLGGTWSVVATLTGAPNLQAVAATKKFIRSAGSWLTDGFRTGMAVDGSGFTNGANNVSGAIITALTATDMTVDAALVDEASTAGRTITQPGKLIDVGTTLKTVTLEQGMLDIPQYIPYRGVAVSAMALNLAPEAMIGGTFTLVGMSAGTFGGTPLDASPDAAPTTSPVGAFTGKLYEGGELMAVATALELTIDNSRRVVPVIGSQYSPDVFEGMCKISGRLTAFFETAGLFNKFLNETASSLYVKMVDPTGGYIVLVLPKVVYEGGEIDPPQEGPVPVALPFRAVVDDVYGKSISFHRSNT